MFVDHFSPFTDDCHVRSLMQLTTSFPLSALTNWIRITLQRYFGQQTHSQFPDIHVYREFVMENGEKHNSNSKPKVVTINENQSIAPSFFLPGYEFVKKSFSDSDHQSTGRMCRNWFTSFNLFFPLGNPLGENITSKNYFPAKWRFRPMSTINNVYKGFSREKLLN